MRIRIRDGNRVIKLEQGEITRLRRAMATVSDIADSQIASTNDVVSTCNTVLDGLNKLLSEYGGEDEQESEKPKKKGK